MPDHNNKKPGGALSNLVFNIVIPVIVLTQLSDPQALGPVVGIIVALIFPIGYGIWDLKRSGKANIFSILGIISVLLTGGISLLQLDPQYIAIKEAAIPAIIGIIILVTQKTRYPIINMLIFNDQIIKTQALHQALEANHVSHLFKKILTRTTYIVASSFALSSILNYLLAKIIVVSPPGTSAFNEELGKMTALSYPVIALPSMIVMLIAIWYLFSQTRKITGKGIEHFIVGMKDYNETKSNPHHD